MSREPVRPQAPRESGAPDAPAAEPPQTLEAVLAMAGGKLLATERCFVGALRSDVSIISDIGSYISQSGGKRIRPLLLLMAARMCGYRGDLDVLMGAVFELIHTATLVHDDVVDEAALRRGRSSINSRWGNHLTVLLGDYLYIKSMNLALEADDIRLIRVLADITLKMIEGELIQAHLDGRLDIDEEQHLDIVRRKTAYLFAGACRIAAMLGGVSPQLERALEQYGLNLGIAFQLVDDLLDYTSQEEVLGKPVLSDLREGKLTLPLIYLLQEAGSECRDAVACVLREREFRTVRKEQILDLVHRHGTLGRARGRATEYAEAARRLLDPFEDSPERRALLQIPEFILSRER